MFVDWTASTTAKSSDLTEILERAIAWTLFALNTLFGIKEAVQSARSGRRAACFWSSWNVIDFICILLVYSDIFSTVIRGGAGRGPVPLVVFPTLFLTLKLLVYLRGFGDTGKWNTNNGLPSTDALSCKTYKMCRLLRKDGSFQCYETTCGT